MGVPFRGFPFCQSALQAELWQHMCKFLLGFLVYFQGFIHSALLYSCSLHPNNSLQSLLPLFLLYLIVSFLGTSSESWHGSNLTELQPSPQVVGVFRASYCTVCSVAPQCYCWASRPSKLLSLSFILFILLSFFTNKHNWLMGIISLLSVLPYHLYCLCLTIPYFHSASPTWVSSPC